MAKDELKIRCGTRNLNLESYLNYKTTLITFAHLCKLKKKTSIKAVDSSSLHAISWISKNDSSYSLVQAKSLYISHSVSAANNYVLCTETPISYSF